MTMTAVGDADTDGYKVYSDGALAPVLVTVTDGLAGNGEGDPRPVITTLDGVGFPFAHDSPTDGEGVLLMSGVVEMVSSGGGDIGGLPIITEFGVLVGDGVAKRMGISD